MYRKQKFEFVSNKKYKDNAYCLYIVLILTIRIMAPHSRDFLSYPEDINENEYENNEDEDEDEDFYVELCCEYPDFIEAVDNNHHDCVIRAVNHARDTDEEWDQDYLYAALEWGNLEYIGFALERCVWDDASIMYAVRSKKMNHVQYMIDGMKGGVWDESVMFEALRAGYLDCVKHAREKMVPWNEMSMWLAVSSGCVKLVEYMLDNGCVLDDTLMIAAFQKNLQNRNRARLAMVQFLHEKGIPWTCESMAGAMLTRDINTVKFAYENGCSCDENILDVRTSLEILDYAFEVMGCKLTSKHMEDAIFHHKNNHVRYLHAKGCPWSLNCINIAYQRMNLDSFNYALANGILDHLKPRDEE